MSYRGSANYILDEKNDVNGKGTKRNPYEFIPGLNLKAAKRWMTANNRGVVHYKWGNEDRTHDAG